jgi:hypothetical protein
MLSERTIINGLITTAGLILGPYLVISMLEANQWPLLIFGGSAFLLFVFFVVREATCLLPLVGLAFIGKLRFLPLDFSTVDVFNLVVILYYCITYLGLKQRKINGGPPHLLIPIIIIVAIVVYHDHKFGLHVMGGRKRDLVPDYSSLSPSRLIFAASIFPRHPLLV